MNCPRCNTELPDSAVFCVQCGSTIRRPVTFSYLPTGVPAWPTEQLKGTQYKNAAPSESDQFVILSEASSVESSDAAQPKKKRPGIPAIIGLFILSILIGGGLTFGILYLNGQRLSIGPQPTLKPLQLPTPVASSTPVSLTPTPQGNQLPTPTAFQSVTSKELGVSLQFPSDWVQDPAQTTSSGNTSVNFHPQQNLPVSMFIAKLSSSVSAQVTDTNEVNQANIQGFGTNNNLLNFKALTDTPLHRTIGGVNWDEQDATYSTSSGLLIHVASISVKHNALYYNILYFAPNTAYDEAFQKYYSPMLNSFKFS
jgi:zinc-ribbon domain